MQLRSALKVSGILTLIAVLGVLAVNLAPRDTPLQKPVPHVVAVSDAAFPRTMQSLFDDDILPGHSVQTLVNGVEIFPPMLEAIASAEVSVNFETYIYWSGDIALRFAQALAAKAREGVPVRVLVDWAGSLPFDTSLMEMMTDAGVAFERFRPIRWYTLDRVNYRTHRKLLIVDGRIGFTGGVGVGDEWMGDARSPTEWRDNHYRVEGPAVGAMQGAFAENWLEATGELLQGDAFYPPLEATGDLYAQHVKSSPNGGSQAMHRMLLLAIASAQEHVRIAMAYFVPDDVSIQQLLDARARGVEVDIIVPGEITDVPLVRHASRHFWGRLLEAGVRIHEYQPTMYHPKVMIVDRHWATVGSTNLDERSFRLNDEANLNVYDTGFAQSQIDVFEEDLAQSVSVSLSAWQNRPLFTKLQDWLASLLRTQL